MTSDQARSEDGDVCAQCGSRFAVAVDNGQRAVDCAEAGLGGDGRAVAGSRSVTDVAGEK